jgi:hypothetical protein
MAINKKTLPPPPTLSETRDNLSQPETAPAKFDKRMLRNTGRTFQYNVRVSPDFQAELNDLMARDRLTGWQWLAVAMEAYKALPNKEREEIIKRITANDPAMQQFPELKR